MFSLSAFGRGFSFLGGCLCGRHRAQAGFLGGFFCSSLEDLLFCGQPEVDLPAYRAIGLEPEMISKPANFLNLRRAQGCLVFVHVLVNGEVDVPSWLHIRLIGIGGWSVMKPFVDATKNGLAARLMMDVCTADKIGVPSRCPLLQLLAECSLLRRG